MSGLRGVTPAVILIDPKYPHNGGGVFRDAVCWDIKQVWITGNRLKDEYERKGRLSREERLRRFRQAAGLFWSDRPFDQFPRGTTFVGVEVLKNAEVLTLNWKHPESAVYVFGPEDGGLNAVVRSLCHRFLIPPSRDCLNLQVAAGMIFGHRMLQRMNDGLEPMRGAAEMFGDRGFADPGDHW